MQMWEEQLQKDVYQGQHVSMYQNQLSDPLLDNEIGRKSQNMCFDGQYGVAENVHSMEIMKCEASSDDDYIEEEAVDVIQDFKFSSTPMTPNNAADVNNSMSS